MRLGDLLVANGLITQMQLDEALRNQSMFGGRLGSNLVELGYIPETKLAEVLSAQLKIPAANAGEFETISSEALAKLDSVTAKKHGVVPLSLEKKTLRLAMSDPTDLRALDEIAFATGCQVKPVVAPEVLIKYALEKSYSVGRPSRYVRLGGATSGEFQVVHTPSAMQSDVDKAAADGEIVDRSEFLDHSRNRQFDASDAAYTLTQASQGFAAVNKPADISAVLLRFAAQNFSQVALFAVRGDQLAGWGQVGCKIDNNQMPRVIFPVAQSELFRLVCGGRVPYIGPPRDATLDNWVFETIGMTPGDELLCLPLLVNSQAVGLLLGSGAPKGQASRLLDRYNVLVTKASYAFQIIFLRTRILAD